MMQSNNINLNIKTVISYRQFCNKIWNTIKFGLMKIGKEFKYNAKINPMNLIFLNQWIINKLNLAIINVNKAFDSYSFG